MTPVGSVGAHRCTSCGTSLASDQRYCVECGERRGKARFALTPEAPPPPAASPIKPRAARGRRAPSSATLVAGIATLLLSMGVGVEIGRLHTNSDANQRASNPAVQVVTLPGPSGASGGGVTSSASTSASPSAPTRRHTATTTPQAGSSKPLPKTVVVKAASQAAKALGAGAPKQPTVQQGQSCSAGTAGCENKKFSGKFFSP